MCSRCGIFFCCCCKDFDADASSSEEQAESAYFPYTNMEDYLGISSKLESGIYIDKGFNKGFCYIYNEKNRVKIEKGFPKEPVGWKIHFSIRREAENMEKAWKILQLVTSQNNLSHIKTPFPSELSRLGEGKEFCLYLFKNEHIDNWPKIIEAVENLFVQDGVVENKSPSEADKKIEGSRYAYYRNDEHPTTGKYISARQAIAFSETNDVEAYNPSEKEDPLEGFKLKSDLIIDVSPF